MLFHRTSRATKNAVPRSALSKFRTIELAIASGILLALAALFIRLFIGDSAHIYQFIRFAHHGAVMCLAYSSDGTLLASGGKDGRVVVYDDMRGDILCSLDLDQLPIISLAFSSDSKRLAFGSESGLLGTLDLERKVVAWKTAGHVGRVERVCISPDGETMISAGNDGLRAWRTCNGARSGTLSTDWIKGTFFLNQSDGLITVSFPGIIERWDQDLQRTGRSPIEEAGYICAAPSPDGRSFATGSTGWRVRVHDTATLKTLKQLKGHYFPICSVSFSANGRFLASLAWSGSFLKPQEIKVWDVASGTEVARYTYRRDHMETLAFSPIANILAVGASDGTIRYIQMAVD
jgi:WD40 repeat protein